MILEFLLYTHPNLQPFLLLISLNDSCTSFFVISDSFHSPNTFIPCFIPTATISNFLSSTTFSNFSTILCQPLPYSIHLSLLHTVLCSCFPLSQMFPLATSSVLSKRFSYPIEMSLLTSISPLICIHFYITHNFSLDSPSLYISHVSP